MKKLITFFLSLFFVILCTTAQAAPLESKISIPFSFYSSANGSAVYSTPIKVHGYPSKTFQVQGYTMSTTTAAALSGTALVQCGPTANGPWAAAQTEAGTAISTTTNKEMQWRDQSPYCRVSWAKTAGLISAYLIFQAW